MKLLELQNKQHKRNSMKQYQQQRMHSNHGHKYHYQQDKGKNHIKNAFRYMFEY